MQVAFQSYLEELHPAFLLGLDPLLNHRVCLDAHAAEGSHVLLAVLCFGLGVGQLDDSQARIPQTARQSHQLYQCEGHHGGLRLTCQEGERTHCLLQILIFTFTWRARQRVTANN